MEWMELKGKKLKTCLKNKEKSDGSKINKMRRCIIRKWW